MEIKNINKTIGRKHIIKDVNLKFESGKIYGFIGPNGSGKSILFKILSGWIIQDNKDKIKYSHKEFIEDTNLYPDKTGYQNLIDLYQINNEEDDLKILYYLEKLGMLKVKDDKVSTYSLGMKQKIAIIQVLMEDAEILILDEPFNSLDKKSCEILMYLLDEKRKEGKIILLTSHINKYLDLLSDYIYYIKDGKITNGKKNELKKDSFKAEKLEQKEGKKKNNILKYLKMVIPAVIFVFILIYAVVANAKLNVAKDLYQKGEYIKAYWTIGKISYPYNKLAKEIKYAGYEFRGFEDDKKRTYNYIDTEDYNSMIEIWLSNVTLIKEYEKRNVKEHADYRIRINDTMIKHYTEITKPLEEKIVLNKHKSKEALETILVNINHQYEQEKELYEKYNMDLTEIEYLYNEKKEILSSLNAKLIGFNINKTQTV